MKMRYTLFVISLVLLTVALSACGASPTATPTPKPTTPATPTVPPTPTQPPTPTPIPPTPIPPTPTPVPPQATATQTVNVRQGPGTNFTIAGKMPKDTSAIVLGKNEDGKWLQVAFPDAAHPGWISAAFATVTGSIDTLPVVAVAPPATATPGGPAPTKAAAAATPTQVFAAPKGTLSFVTFDPNQNSYILNNLEVTSHNFSGDRLLGPKPGVIDIRNGTNAAPFAWSPNGSWLAYVYSSNSLVDVLRVTDSAGEAHDVVSHGGGSAPGGISSPTWSPDSSTVAYIGIDSNYTRQAIYKIDAGGGTESLFFAARSGEVLRGLAWGKTYFLFVSNLTGASEIWRLNSDGSGPLQLTTDKTEDGSPAWSPDGKQFAYYSKRSNGYQIMVANADGSGAHALTNSANNWSPVWSPDGNWIAFSSTRGGGLAIYMMDKNGGNVKLLTDKVQTESFLPGSWR